MCKTNEEANIIELQPMKNGTTFKMLKKYIAKIEYDDKKGIVEIEEGFLTDFASIPKSLYSIVGSPVGLYTEAAIIHDYLYYKHDIMLDDFTIVTLNRKQIDLVFYNKMLESQVGKLKARTMWLAVRTFGWKFYKK